MLIFTFFVLSFFWIFVAALPKTGPCTLGTYQNSSLLKCTEKGYFELTQCFEKYCVCVDPRTGHEADGTRTFSNRILPRCGQCFSRLARLLASNVTMSLPACEGDYGNYQSKQCVDIRCACVDIQDGKVLKRGDPNLNCETEFSPVQISFSIDSIPADKSHEQVPLANFKCALARDRGYTCSNVTSRIMWYYDTSVFQCLAFKFNGCGGNWNRFKTINECWSSCILQDFGGCAGMRPPLRDPVGETVICRTRRDRDVEIARDCPSGYKCTHLPFFSICCEEQNEELYLRNHSPTCGIEQNPPANFTAGGIVMNLLGKSCADDFCPENHDCKQLEVMAHCCPRRR